VIFSAFSHPQAKQEKCGKFLKVFFKRRLPGLRAKPEFMVSIYFYDSHTRPSLSGTPDF
jgi:hypothetical protein